MNETATLNTAVRENADAVSRLIDQYRRAVEGKGNVRGVVKFALLLWHVVRDVWEQFQLDLDQGLGVRTKGGRLFEVVTTGTVSVLDRRGRRLGTVYLAYTPESGQGTMGRALTGLLTAVLERWQGPLPRLCYVTDAGDNETTYYAGVLRRFRHPRTGEALEWTRVVDYYHVSERVWVRGELLFGKGQRSAAWVRKRQRWLLKPGA